MSDTTTESLRVANAELATVREAMRELHLLLDRLDQHQVEKIVLTQKNQMRAVLVSVERYAQLEHDAGLERPAAPAARPRAVA